MSCNPDINLASIEDEPKAIIELSAQWRFTMGAKDTVILLRALRGVLFPEELEYAKELSRRLIEAREQTTRNLYFQMKVNADNMRKGN